MSELFKKALDIAYERHKNQIRKGKNKGMYIFHPLEVASIASYLTSDENVLCAALLHDTVEDTGYTIDEIKKEFNDDVAFIVSMETEDKMPNLPSKDTWKLRKSILIENLKRCDDVRVHILVLSDKLANLRSLYTEYKDTGDEVFNIFNEKRKSEHKWNYESLLEIVSKYLKNTSQYEEAIELKNKIFGE